MKPRIETRMVVALACCFSLVQDQNGQQALALFCSAEANTLAGKRSPRGRGGELPIRGALFRVCCIYLRCMSVQLKVEVF